jgi:hypothetical protein
MKVLFDGEDLASGSFTVRGSPFAVNGWGSQFGVRGAWAFARDIFAIFGWKELF